MSNTKNTIKPLKDKISTTNLSDKNGDDGETLLCTPSVTSTYSVTISKKLPIQAVDETPLCSGQKSFISIHSTDHLCQIADDSNCTNLDECNVEVLSLNKVFPSTSEESDSYDDDPLVPSGAKDKRGGKQSHKTEEGAAKCVPTNSKATGRPKENTEAKSSLHPDVDIPKNTLFVVGSNPGEPKMAYADSPKKISKTMRKFLRNLDKHKNDQSGKSGEKAISKLTTMRGILKDGRCGPECTGDSTAQSEDVEQGDETFPIEFNAQTYAKQNPEKNVSFNSKVVIIHFTGDLCVGQSVEALSKEKDQQERNSELRKTFLTKFNEFWPTNQ